MMIRCITAAALWVAAVCVFAQVEVIDRPIPVAKGHSSSPPPASAPADQSVANNAAELHYQLQVLQQEVQQLRGLVEEQSYQLKKLKQQRLDDYLDLDRRIGELSNKPASQTSSTTTSASSSTPRVTSTTSGSSSTSSSGADEMKRYRAAMNLVLKERRYDEGASALKQYLEDFPTGRFSANVKYWLGEVYLEKKAFEDSRQWFARVLSEHPQSNKVPDAQYKLGVVYHMLGDKPKAKELLNTVAKSNSNAARLATSFLQSHYSQ